VLSVALACTDAPIASNAAALCSGLVQVSASDGTTPLFRWVPPCGVSYLSVTPVTPTDALEPPIWSVEVPESAPARSGVRYGQTPRGGRTLRSAARLVRGATYRVSVISTVGGDVRLGGGETVFIP